MVSKFKAGGEERSCIRKATLLYDWLAANWIPAATVRKSLISIISNGRRSRIKEAYEIEAKILRSSINCLLLMYHIWNYHNSGDYSSSIVATRSVAIMVEL